MSLNNYPIPIPSPLVLQSPQPATIIAPRAGVVAIRHYWGSTADRNKDRLWINLPTSQAREVTNGIEVVPWPGDEVLIPVEASDEIEVAINGGSDSSLGPPNTVPTFTNKSDNARVHEDPTLPGGWGRYIEWEDLVLDGTNDFYNDSRTLIWYRTSRWVVGRIGR